jgi:hypothetical protein
MRASPNCARLLAISSFRGLAAESTDLHGDWSVDDLPRRAPGLLRKGLDVDGLERRRRDRHLHRAIPGAVFDFDDLLEGRHFYRFTCLQWAVMLSPGRLGGWDIRNASISFARSAMHSFLVGNSCWACPFIVLPPFVIENTRTKTAAWLMVITQSLPGTLPLSAFELVPNTPGRRGTGTFPCPAWTGKTRIC